MKRGVSLHLVPVALLLAACGARGEPSPGTPPAAQALEPPPKADSLILSGRQGVSIWLTEGRMARDSSGSSCLERTLEIRHDTTRIKVPLLYTVSTPSFLDDTTLRAELASNCRPAQAYRVNLRTGQPTPIRASQP